MSATDTCIDQVHLGSENILSNLVMFHQFPFVNDVAPKGRFIRKAGDHSIRSSFIGLKPMKFISVE